MEETADEYLVSHVTPAHDDDAVAHDDYVIAHDDDARAHEDDVIGHVSMGDDHDEEGQAGEHEDTSEDVPKNEDMEIEKKVKWQDSEGSWTQVLFITAFI